MIKKLGLFIQILNYITIQYINYIFLLLYIFLLNKKKNIIKWKNKIIQLKW